MSVIFNNQATKIREIGKVGMSVVEPDSEVVWSVQQLVQLEN
jgi:hypothetical protein